MCCHQSPGKIGGIDAPLHPREDPMAKKAARPKHVEPADVPHGPPGPDTVEQADGKALSKAEAVRRALAAGHEGPQEGTAYIRDEFGIEVAPQHFSATKSQIKSREGARKAKGKPGRKPKGAPGQA